MSTTSFKKGQRVAVVHSTDEPDVKIGSIGIVEDFTGYSFPILVRFDEHYNPGKNGAFFYEWELIDEQTHLFNQLIDEYYQV